MEDAKERIKKWETGPVRHKTTKRRKQESLTAGERRRFTQLLVCLLVFAFVFLGRGAPEGKLHSIGDTLGQWVHQNTDFRAAFSRVGKSVSEGEPAVETFGLLWSELFGSASGGEKGTSEESERVTEGEGGVLPPTDSQSNATPDGDVGSAGQVLDGGSDTQQAAQTTNQQPAVTKEQTSDAQAKTTEQSKTAAKLTNEETVVPVMGVLTSGFGYRTHPIDGEWKDHEGIDIMADEGTPIKAFADGQVDYVGESPAYGMYLQIKHGQGVSSFYAHCSALLVKKGQKVSAGDIIAKVGATGNATGPHLHLELKKDGVRVDPALYVKTLSQ